jgi:hypothetical protein
MIKKSMIAIPAISQVRKFFLLISYPGILFLYRSHRFAFIVRMKRIVVSRWLFSWIAVMQDACSPN